MRLDFFGDTLESVRHFDPASQRTTTQAKELALSAMSEVTLEPETISRFRTNYLARFGAATRDDALYVAISEGRRYPGMEHWLPLFHDRMETVFEYLAGFSHRRRPHAGGSCQRTPRTDRRSLRGARPRRSRSRRTKEHARHAVQGDRAGSALISTRRNSSPGSMAGMRSGSPRFTNPKAARGRVIELGTVTGAALGGGRGSRQIGRRRAGPISSTSSSPMSAASVPRAARS